jgi:hypothetical protein
LALGRKPRHANWLIATLADQSRQRRGILAANPRARPDPASYPADALGS